MILLLYSAGRIHQAPKTVHERRTMMSLSRKILMIVVALSLTVSVCSCKKEGPAERAGKEIDRAFDNAKDKLDEATK